MNMEDDAYRGYNVDGTGQVVEIYDHRNDERLKNTSGPQRSDNIPLMQSEVNPNITNPNLHFNPNLINGLNALPPAAYPQQQPIIMLEEHKKKKSNGCCASCIGCLNSCNRMPCCSLFSFLMILIGTATVCVAGWFVMSQSMGLWKTYRVVFLKCHILRQNTVILGHFLFKDVIFGRFFGSKHVILGHFRS